MADADQTREYERRKAAIEATDAPDERKIRQLAALDRAYASVLKTKQDALPAWGYQVTVTIVAEGEPAEGWTEDVIKLLGEMTPPPRTTFVGMTIDAVKEQPLDQGEEHGHSHD